MRDSVEFLPFVDRHKILPIYQSASIFCAPSNWNEPCTLTIPEAMACGAPTIASRRGGIPEMAGTAALYFDAPNVDQLAELLAHLIDDEKARREWSLKARVRAEECDWSHRYLSLRRAIGLR
jgi:glycosyltransferase involved in cell wall biosynthesis